MKTMTLLYSFAQRLFADHTANAAIYRQRLLLCLAVLLAAWYWCPPARPAWVFQEGQPWAYRDLRARIAFDVLRPEADVQSELARIAAEHGPYCYWRPEVARQQKRYLVELIDKRRRISQHDLQYEDLIANAHLYQDFGETLLDRMYAIGVLDEAESADWPKSATGMVWLWDGHREVSRPRDALLTRETARNFLADSLPFSSLREPEMLLSLLEESVQPNLFYSDSLTSARRQEKMAAALRTGLSVQQGEIIVRRGDVVTCEMAQKIDSLLRQGCQPVNWLRRIALVLMLAAGAGVVFYGGKLYSTCCATD